MKRLVLLSIVAVVLVFAATGCGGTSTGPSDNGSGNNVQTAGQDPAQQPASGGLKNASYTAAHNACSLYTLADLAQQNGVKATPQAVAKVYESGETTAANKKQAYQGCLDAINGK
jgi:hypothetical protein